MHCRYSFPSHKSNTCAAPFEPACIMVKLSARVTEVLKCNGIEADTNLSLPSCNTIHQDNTNKAQSFSHIPITLPGGVIRSFITCEVPSLGLSLCKIDIFQPQI